MSVHRFRSPAAEPHDRGVMFGRAHSAQVCATVAAYQRLFDRAAGTPVDTESLGARAYEHIDREAPDIAAEIAGIADGSGCGVHQIAAINARTEVLAWAHRSSATRGAHECSTVVKLDGNRPPITLQTWDWYADLDDLWFVWDIEHTDGRITRTATEYGIVGKFGLNDSGLGVLFNILHHDGDGADIAMPVHVLARRVLDEAADINQALVLLAGAQVSASSCLTLVADDGTDSAAIGVELNPHRVGYAPPDARGLLLHTNHFLSEPANRHDTEPVHGPDSLVRYDLLFRKLSGRDDLSHADVIEAMDSHIVGGGSVCCHPDPALDADAQFQTLATITLDLRTTELEATSGGPCTHPLNRRNAHETRRTA